MAPKAKDWLLVGKTGLIYRRGPKEYRLQTDEGYCSKIYTSLADAKRLGLPEYFDWKEQGHGAAPAADEHLAAQPAAASPPARKKRAKKQKASPDPSADEGLPVKAQQQAAAAEPDEAAAPRAHARKRGQAQPPAAANKRPRSNAPLPAAAAAAGSDSLGTSDTIVISDADPETSMEQTPSAATDAATMPFENKRKQQRKPAQRAAAGGAAHHQDAGEQQPAQQPVRKRGRQPAAAAAAAGQDDQQAGAAAAGAWEQPRANARQTKRVVRKPAAAAAAAAAAGPEPMDVDEPLAPAAEAQQRPLRRGRGRAAAAEADAEAQAVAAVGLAAFEDTKPAPAAAAEGGPRALRPRRVQGAAAGAAGAEAAAGRPTRQRVRGKQQQQQQHDPEDSDWDMQDAEQQQQQQVGGLHHQHAEGHGFRSEPSAGRQPSSAGCVPSSVVMQQEQVGTNESLGSNWLAPEAAAGGQQHAGPDGSSLHVWYQGSKQVSDGLSLDLQLQQQLGKGGFGAVHKVLVRATGDNSLAGLRLTGPLNNSLKTLVKQSKTKAKGSTGRGAAAAGSKGGQTARSRAGSRGGSNGGSNGGSDGSSDGGAWVPMAMKVALRFDQLSQDMQDNFKETAVFDANVQQRMRDEYDVMTTCAASPHILDAYCMGTVWLGGSWRPCILMELTSLGDAERVYIKPASSIGGSAPRGISSVATQRIVRQAAVALKDLHSMAGHMHLDLKVNNLLVFGTEESPVIKLCDFGCAKKRSDEPRYGPASGTKDWQAPEQMAADAVEGPKAGRLDYTTDSWALGLLVLSLRKGQQPFWWLKQEGKLPSEMPDALRANLSTPSSPYLLDSPRGSKLTRLEVSFVTTCLASHSSKRPPVKDLLEDAPYLSSRYRGG